MKGEFVKPYTKEEITERCENIYKLYPRKEGKQKGLVKLRSLIKTEADYLKIIKSVENYKKQLEIKKTSKEYTLMFSTFINGRWEDYLDIDIEPEQVPHIDLLSQIGLQFQFSKHVNRIISIWPSEDEFKQYLINKKEWFNTHDSVENNKDKFRAYVAKDLARMVGL